MSKLNAQQRAQQLHARLRQLILMRETGPKRPAWHAQRMRMIWRLHDELREAETQAKAEEQEQLNRKEIGAE
jgi:uncharacterized coiled-coil DUF342 family protein